MNRLHQAAQLVIRYLIRYLVAMFASFMISALPVLLLAFSSYAVLDSMFSNTGAMLNLSGKDNFDPAIGQQIVNEYKEKAEGWKKGLTSEEIDEVYKYHHDLPWSVMVAVDKLAYNFDDLSKKDEYLNKTYELLKPSFRFRDSKTITITVKKDAEGNVVGKERTVEIHRVLAYAETYIGTYEYHYEEITETLGDTTIIREQLVRVDSEENYLKLKDALSHYELETNQNSEIVIFQAFGLDRNLKDPMVKNLFPPELWSVVARSHFGLAPINDRGEIDLYAILPVQLPDNYLQTLKIQVQAYDQSWRRESERTEVGSLPRRGSNYRFGTAAVARDNSFGLETGMKIYVPGYGYAVIEEYSENVYDRFLEDPKLLEWIKNLTLSGPIADAILEKIGAKTRKSDVLYVFMGDLEPNESKLFNSQLEFAGVTEKYRERTIYILQPDYEIPQPQQEERGTFYDGSTWSLTSPFGYRINPITNAQEFHSGQDYAVPSGTPVLAINSGTIEIARYHQSAGNYIKLRLDNKVRIAGRDVSIHARYLHMSELVVVEGQRVERGELLGYTGSTGQSTGPHMHFEIWVNGTPRNPLDWVELAKADGLLDVIDGQPDYEGGKFHED